MLSNKVDCAHSTRSYSYSIHDSIECAPAIRCIECIDLSLNALTGRRRSRVELIVCYRTIRKLNLVILSRDKIRKSIYSNLFSMRWIYKFSNIPNATNRAPCIIIITIVDCHAKFPNSVWTWFYCRERERERMEDDGGKKCVNCDCEYGIPVESENGWNFLQSHSTECT